MISMFSNSCNLLSWSFIINIWAWSIFAEEQGARTINYWAALHLTKKEEENESSWHKI